MTDKEKLKEANKLIESLFYKVYHGYSYRDGDLRLHADTSVQHNVIDYFKATKQRTKLKRPEVKKGSVILAC